MRSVAIAALLCAVLLVVLNYDRTGAEVNAQSGGKFAVISYTWANNFGFTKYNVSTGEAFYAGANSVWGKYAETGPIPTGQYEIQPAVTATNFHSVVRIEKNSGRVWYSSNNKWVEMKNPDPAAPAAANTVTNVKRP
jgi:hypothetical protein